MPGDYLHLIDNATGIDIDLMQTPSYIFDSKDCNYATRLRLVLDEEATNEIVDSFAYLSNGQLIINGTGTLQVMDIRLILQSAAVSFCSSALAQPTP